MLDFEAIVIGSGFGGAVACARLAKRWPGGVALLEQGREYDLGTFPRSPAALANNFWCPDHEQISRPRHILRRRSGDAAAGFGLFDIRRFKRMDTICCAGLGGGSLIYANVLLRPPASTFDEQWPQTLSLKRLAPYYDVVQQVLGARPIPPDRGSKDRRYVQRTHAFHRFAASQGLRARMADLAVFFGNGYSYRSQEQPTAIGVQEINRYGARQTSCTYCGECNLGCNVRAKNTTDLNYLHVARTVHGATIHTQAQVDRVVPLGPDGSDDPQQRGDYGYRVWYQQLDTGEVRSLTAQRIVVSAGTLGSNELLLRCRDVHHCLPHLSPRLGQRFSGNGDFLSFVLDGQREINSTYGPVITQYTDHHLYEDHDPQRAFLLQDASFPSSAAWAVAALQPVAHPLTHSLNALRILSGLLLALPYPGRSSARLGGLIRQFLNRDLSQNSAVLLFMGVDRADGRFSLNRDGWLALDWPQHSSRSLYEAMLATTRRFRRFMKARTTLPLPTWLWPLRRNISVHPLGGCALALQAASGVVSAAEADRGRVFGYQGLYVADGSIMPTALGSNPAATIAALSEWIAHGITGIAPDATLE